LTLVKPTQQQQQREEQLVQQAISLQPNSPVQGLTFDWWQSMNKALSTVIVGLALLALGGVYLVIQYSYPNVPADQIYTWLNNIWGEILAKNYNSYTIFTYGVFLPQFLIWVVVGGFFLILDLTRPAVLLPFKTQPNAVLDKTDLARAISVGMMNHVLSFLLCLGCAYLQPNIAPTAFAQNLPSLFQAAVHLVCFFGFYEIVFFAGHWLCHYNYWMYTHVHYLHHTWQAPISISCIYAHPLEHFLANFMGMAAGPIVMGSHISLWWAWAVITMAGTSIDHCGWHLPLLPSPENHEYHHVQGEDCLCSYAPFDYIFGTASNWLTSWQMLIDKQYMNADYPVEKILAAAGQPINSEPPVVVTPSPDTVKTVE